MVNTEAKINELSNRLQALNGFTCYKDEYTENKIVVNGFSVEGVNDYKIFTLPKTKQIDLNWLLEKCDKVATTCEYVNLKPVFEKLNIQGNIYYTSFGFSFDCFFKRQKEIDAQTQIIKDKLDEIGIKYTNEYSDAFFVYRFKISKAKENLELINGLGNN